MKVAIFAFIAFLVVSCRGQCQPYLPVPQYQQDWMQWNWRDRFEAHAYNTRYNAQYINLIFQGDSITEGWDYMANDIWTRHYGEKGGVNYGIGGDGTQHVLWRIQNGEMESINLRPRLLVLKIGTNNIGSCPEDGIAYGVAAIVRDLRRILPEMKILVLGILPRYDSTQTEITDRINSMIEPQVVEGDMVRFLNMRDTYYNNDTQQLRYEMFNEDGLHLSSAGYSAWQTTMDPLFLEMWN